MKKSQMVLVVFIVALGCAAVFAKGAGKGQKKGQSAKSTKAAKSEIVDVNNPDLESSAEKVKKNEHRQGRAKSKVKAAHEKKQETKAGQQKNIKQQDAFTKQIGHEEKKHARRQARLERIRQLAEESNDEKILERVNRLIEKEQGRYDKKMQKIKQRQADTLSKTKTDKVDKPEKKDPNENDDKKDED